MGSASGLGCGQIWFSLFLIIESKGKICSLESAHRNCKVFPCWSSRRKTVPALTWGSEGACAKNPQGIAGSVPGHQQRSQHLILCVCGQEEERISEKLWQEKFFLVGFKGITLSTCWGGVSGQQQVVFCDFYMISVYLGKFKSTGNTDGQRHQCSWDNGYSGIICYYCYWNFNSCMRN